MAVQPATVFIVEDDRVKRDKIKQAICNYDAWQERYTFSFIIARDYPSAFAEIESLIEPPLFTVMDSKLPGVPVKISSEQGGAHLCKKLRSKRSLVSEQGFREWIQTPVIFYSGLTDIDAHLSAMEAHATTYVEKDKSLEDLLRIIDFQLEKSSSSDTAAVAVPELTIEYGPLVLKIQKMADSFNPIPMGEVYFEGKVVALSKREFVLFAIIVQKLPTICTFDALQDTLEELEQSLFNSKDSADKAMSPLRKKFEAVSPGFIEQCQKHNRFLVSETDIGGWTWRDDESQRKVLGGI